MKTSASVSPRNSVKKATVIRNVAGAQIKSTNNAPLEQMNQWPNNKILVNTSGLSISPNNVSTQNPKSSKNSNNTT